MASSSHSSSVLSTESVAESTLKTDEGEEASGESRAKSGTISLLIRQEKGKFTVICHRKTRIFWSSWNERAKVKAITESEQVSQ